MDQGIHANGRSAGATMTVGVLLILLGAYALYYFLAATVATVYLLAIMLMVGGIFHAVNAFSAGKWGAAMLDVLAAALYIVAGVVALREPVLTASVVTIALSAMYMFQGIMRIVAALALKGRQWGWVLVNGIVVFGFGIAVFATWPVSAVWLLGTLIGVDMLFSGWTMLMIGWALHRERPVAPLLRSSHA